MLRFRLNSADKVGMNSFGMLGTLSLALLFSVNAMAGEGPACKRLADKTASLEKQRTLSTDQAFSSDTTMESKIRTLEQDVARARVDCQEEKDKVQGEKSRCEAKARQHPEIFSWSETDQTCEDKSSKSKANNESGDCSNASLFKGSLRGQACKNTADTVKDVTAQNEALTASTTAITTVFSSAQAMGATGAQNDAQERQKKIMQALAISKIATGGLALSNAARLKSAASDAEDASSSISSAQKDLSNFCDTDPQAKSLSADQCFFKYAPSRNIEVTEASRANFERMRSASSQSQEQADKASNLAKAAMVQGMADALVGVQALQLANQAQNNAAQAGTLPQVAALAPTVLRGTSGGSLGGFGTTEGTGTPVDYGVTSDGGGVGLGGQVGGFRNGIKDGKGFGRASGGGSPARSSVTTAGANGAGGGGGGGGGGGKGGGGKGRGSAPNNIGEYTLGGSLGGPRGGPAGAEKNDGPNPFAEALAKLFPKDAAGKPVVDTRELASSENPEIYDDAVTGADDIVAADLSLFEQVTAKYRQLNSNGRL